MGWNGTGKSNLLEVLVIIFRDLHRWWDKNDWTKKPMKGYRLRYEIDGKTVEVVWQPEEMKRPRLRMGTINDELEEPEVFENIPREELPLPKFIFGYYSGPTNRLAEHFFPMKQDHYNRLRKATSDDPAILTELLEQRRFFCAENHHAKYVLLAFCHKEDADISRFLEDKLRIVGFESALFIIRKPRWAKGSSAEDFWGATGIMRRVMERLRRFAIAPMVVKQTVPDGWRSSHEDHYYFFLPDLQSLHAFAAEYQNARSFFLALESTDFSELIYDLKIQVRVKATNTKQVAITFHELSEGEQQLLMVLGLMRFTKSHQSLVLLDEPDTHLNPHWSVDYLKLLTRVMSENFNESEEQQTSQILMSTHDPLVIASLFKEQIHLLKRNWETGICRWYQSTVNPRGLGFTGILTSEMFGMRSDLDEETLADLDNKVRLVAKEDSLTPEEAEELEKINKRLEDAGFQKAFSDPYYAAFIRAWGRRHSDLMAGARFLSPAQREEIDRISSEVLEEAITELQAEAVK
ncbi:AAA family ATPase [Kovacikia minuta]|uniref:AAA family ATPase n=1 Tax=Kovacikia minuta TaxID=2931930 RepID=UPI0036F30FEC